MTKFWRPMAILIGAIVLIMAGWGIYKLIIANHAVKDAKLAKAYEEQKDSTKVWKSLYRATEASRANLHDSLNILDGLLNISHTETVKWHDAAMVAKGRLIVIKRPAEADSTNPKWMHRSVELEQIVASQDRELAGKDAELSLVNTKVKLLLSQMSKDSVALHSANGNIDRLNKLVEEYKAASECKIAWLIPCPNRTMAVVGGTVLGIVGTVVVENSKPKK